MSNLFPYYECENFSEFIHLLLKTLIDRFPEFRAFCEELQIYKSEYNLYIYHSKITNDFNVVALVGSIEECAVLFQEDKMFCIINRDLEIKHYKIKEGEK